MSECGATGSSSRHLVGSASWSLACPVPQSATLWGRQPPPYCESSPPRLPVSAPPTGLDECSFFISLIIGLPCGSIFCQFSLFFVFKLLLSFFGCARRRSVSTYASILAGSWLHFLNVERQRKHINGTNCGQSMPSTHQINEQSRAKRKNTLHVCQWKAKGITNMLLL